MRREDGSGVRADVDETQQHRGKVGTRTSKHTQQRRAMELAQIASQIRLQTALAASLTSEVEALRCQMSMPAQLTSLLAHNWLLRRRLLLQSTSLSPLSRPSPLPSPLSHTTALLLYTSVGVALVGLSLRAAAAAASSFACVVPVCVALVMAEAFVARWFPKKHQVRTRQTLTFTALAHPFFDISRPACDFACFSAADSDSPPSSSAAQLVVATLAMYTGLYGFYRMVKGNPQPLTERESQRHRAHHTSTSCHKPALLPAAQAVAFADPSITPTLSRLPSSSPLCSWCVGQSGRRRRLQRRWLLWVPLRLLREATRAPRSTSSTNGRPTQTT